MKPWKPILAALVIFLAGWVVGGLTFPARTSIGVGDPGDGRRFEGRRDRHGQSGRPWSPVLSEEQIGGICGRMTEDLNLSLAQSNRISVVLHEGQLRMKSIADEFHPRTREEFQRTRDEIRAVLTEEQLQKFEEGIKNRQKSWRRSGGGGPAGPGGGPPGPGSGGRPRPEPGSDPEAAVPPEP